jgi:hypothetical protein
MSTTGGCSNWPAGVPAVGTACWEAGPPPAAEAALDLRSRSAALVSALTGSLVHNSTENGSQQQYKGGDARLAAWLQWSWFHWCSFRAYFRHYLSAIDHSGGHKRSKVSRDS